MCYLEVFHVTTRKAAESILRSGFEPRIGPRSQWLGEKVRATYFFTSKEDLDFAANNWLSEAFEDVDDQLIVIIVAVRPGMLYVDPTVGFEAVAWTPVPAAAILRAYDLDSGAVLFDADAYRLSMGVLGTSRQIIEKGM